MEKMLFFFYLIWLTQVAFVELQECPIPPDFLFGNVNPGSLTVGSVRTYSCSAEYQAVGDTTIECQPNLRWTQLKLSCLPCPPPDEEFGCGYISDGPNTLYSTREYVCTTGREARRPITIECLPGFDSPEWSRPASNLKCRGCRASRRGNQGGRTSRRGNQGDRHGQPAPASAPVTAFRCSTGLISIGPGEVSCIDGTGTSLWTKAVKGLQKQGQGCIGTSNLASVKTLTKIPNSCKSNPCLNGGQCENMVTGFKCICSGGYVGTICEGLKSACDEILASKAGEVSGVYTVQLKGAGKFKVVCDMDTDGGGWTVFQSRVNVEDTTALFSKPWKDYKEGFGIVDPSQSFWLGLEKLHLLTNSGSYEVRMYMERTTQTNTVKGAAIYKNFKIGNEAIKYQLSIGAYDYDKSPGYTNPTDTFTKHNGAMFETIDRPIVAIFDGNKMLNCTSYYKGGWWYIMTYCCLVELNGRVPRWDKFNNYLTLTKTKMMIRKM